MSVTRNKFINPANGNTYTWAMNHIEEDESTKNRNITVTAPTGSIGLVRQQGDDQPYVMRWRGKILRRSQYQAMWDWYELSRTQTIYLEDFDGQKYEVQITAFSPQRVRGYRPGTGGDPKHHTWTYSIEFTVYRFLVGDMVGTTP